MKKQYIKQHLLFITLIGVSVFTSSDLFGELNPAMAKSKKSPDFLSSFYPDSTFEDSLNYEFGDTIEAYLDGGDSVYILSSGSDSTNRLTSLEDIHIRLSSVEKAVEDGNYGVTISDFFTPTHAPASNNTNYPAGQDPWNLISDMAPTVLRYPGGASSKFRHAFGSMNTAPWNYEAGLKNGGYGICLEEIITFYDRTDDEIEFTEVLALDIIDDMEETGVGEGKLNTVNGWLSRREVSNFEDFYNEWKRQPKYLPTAVPDIPSEQLYINEFIDLVEKIETENPGLDVKVILVINIMSEPAAAVRDMINYLRDETLNERYSVNVYGIELGNECFFRVFENLLGFADIDGFTLVDGVPVATTKTSFDHYWAYINGAEDYFEYFDWTTPLPIDEFDLTQVLPTSMYGMVDGYQAHDYIGLLRNDPDMDDIKIGIPAAAPIDPDGPFVADEDDIGDALYLLGEPTSSPWNEDLYSHYDDMVDGKPAFDAVIAHLYFVAKNDDVPAANDNWGEIPLGIDSDGPDVDAIPGEFRLDNDDEDVLHDNFSTIPFTPYNYAALDARINIAFNAIIGDGSETGNFKEYLTSRHRISMQILATELHFEVGELNPKDCWITEWNIKNNSKYENDIDDPDYDADGEAKELRRDVYNNSFVHSYLIQEQYLNTLRFNAHSNPADFGMRNNFTTIGTIQNFLGGSSIQLVTQSNAQDRVATGLDDNCASPFDHYVPRALYHSYNLLGPIHHEDLNYVGTVKNKFEANNNIAPTFFVTQTSPTYTEREVYGYFTNVKSEPQTYIIRPGSMTILSFNGLHAEINCIDVTQLYSNSGKSALFDINSFYNSCTVPAPANYFEIQGQVPAYIDTEECPTDVAANAMCVTVPGYSLGYFVFSFDPSARMGEMVNKFQIFPNPASTYFTITQTDIRQDEFSNLEIKIYSMYGELVYQTTIDENESVPIGNLPVGCYQVYISDDNYIEAEMFIKMK